MKKQIKVSEEFKSWLDTKKLVPEEQYENVLKRLVKYKGGK